MIEEFSDEQLPDVIVHTWSRTFHGGPPVKYRRPSRKDGGRIVKAVMSYISEKQWFAKEYVPRPRIEK